MTGAELKRILLGTDKSLTEIANLLHTSSQNLNSIFKVADIKSGLIERLSMLLNLNITDFYQNVPMPKDVSTTKEVSPTVDRMLNEISAQRKMAEKNNEQVDRLLSIIERMQKN